MTRDDFLKLQQAELEIMDEIHRICELRAIPYYMMGGTGLGAIRHQGFIPWDVDIDISMLRADYDRFKKACAKELDPRFEYKDYLNMPEYDKPHAVVCMRGTSLTSVFHPFNKRLSDYGIFVDVFPLDNSPDTAREREAHEKAIVRLKRLKEYKLATCYDASRLKKAIKELRRFLLFGVTVDGLNQKLDEEMRKYNDRETSFVCNKAGRYDYETECMPRAVFGTPVLMPFAGREYYAPERLSDYLTHIYGDYMQLPPIEAREESLSRFQTVTFADS